MRNTFVLMKRVSRLVSLLGFAALLAGCYTVPETGRHALILISKDQEIAMGASSFAELKTSKTISHDPEMNATVQRVGQRISRAVGNDLPGANWEFVVFDDDTPNAFALPGGKVGVHTGIFKVAQNDAELAVVMGHEIGHVTARHGAQRISEALLVAAGGVALDIALHDKESKERNLWLAGYGVGATGLVVLPNSRQNESEADEIGIRYAARAGYDPRAAISFWRRMKEASEGKNKLPEFLSTHPSDDRRIAHLEKIMPDAVALYEESLKN